MGHKDRTVQLHEDLDHLLEVEISNADHNTFAKSAQDLEELFDKGFHCKKAFSVLGKDRLSYCDNAQTHYIHYVKDLKC